KNEFKRPRFAGPSFFNPGRNSTYKTGKTVQTNRATSIDFIHACKLDPGSEFFVIAPAKSFRKPDLGRDFDGVRGRRFPFVDDAGRRALAPVFPGSLIGRCPPGLKNRDEGLGAPVRLAWSLLPRFQ